MMQGCLKYCIYAVVLSIAAQLARTYGEHWIERSDHAASARRYLESDVCQKAELRVQVGKWQKCAESKYELRLSPALRALYDTLEDFSICGHKRCEALSAWFHSWRYAILASFAGMLYCVYEFYKWQQQMNMVNKFMGAQLPSRICN